MNKIVEKLKEAMRQVGDGETTAYNSIAEVIEALTALPVSEQEPFCYVPMVKEGNPMISSDTSTIMGYEEKKHADWEVDDLIKSGNKDAFVATLYRSPVCADKKRHFSDEELAEMKRCLDANKEQTEIDRRVSPETMEITFGRSVCADKDAEIERLKAKIEELRAMNKAKEARILILTNKIFGIKNERGLSFDEAISELNRQEEEAGYYKDQECKIIADQEQTIQTLREAKDNAYTERNKLVAFLSHIYPAHIKLHPASDTSWDDDWRTIICIHSPMGQLTWHIHDSEAGMFGHLNIKPDPFTDCEWDGHTTDEKYRRLLSVSALNGKEGEDEIYKDKTQS